MQKEARFRALLEEQQESGLTIKEFCLNHSIAEATFHYWKKKTQKRPVKKDFIPLVVKPDATPASTPEDRIPRTFNAGSKNKAQLELVYPNGTVLRIKQDLDLAHLRALIHLYD